MVKFFKELNQLKLSFSVVVAITGIEYAHDSNCLQSIVYLLRSISVFLNQNSFLKVIVTMQTWDPPSKELHSLLEEETIPEGTKDPETPYEKALARDIPYQLQI